MSKYIPGNQKHLTLNDRIYIENELSKGATFKDIAAFLCKDPTTISKEVKSRRLSDWYHKGTFYNAKNFCVHRYHCKKTNACGKIMLCGIKCTSCPTCNQTCKDFEKERCSRLDKAPYVCNGCPMKINHCTIAHKYRYDARFADRKYREVLSSSRAGINMTRHQLHQKDQIVTPLIAQGQSPYQILSNHPELDMSVRSIAINLVGCHTNCIAETAKANNLKPYHYFEYLLTEIPKHMDDHEILVSVKICSLGQISCQQNAENNLVTNAAALRSG